MTLPGLPSNDKGVAYIRLEVDADNLPEDMKLAVEKAAIEAERTEGPIAGQHIGKGVGTGIEKELEKPAHGTGIARAVERSLKDEHVDSSHLFQDAENDVGRVGRDVADEFIRAFENAILPSGGGGGGTNKGIFSVISTAFTDAIGAIGNVPGGSPLVAVLVPAFGALANVIGSALEAVQALSAALFALPTLLSAVGFEGLTLFLIFHKMGTAISKAFAATDAKQFAAALKGLEPPAQKFLTQFIPAVKQFMDILSTNAQTNFFWKLGNVILPATIHQLTRELVPAVREIASAFGYMAEHIAMFLAQADVAKFIKDIGEATGEFLMAATPALVKLFDGFTRFADAMIPFTNKIGAGLLNLISKLGDWLGKIADDPKFQKWLDDMLPVLGLVGDVLKAAGGFIISFFDALNQANGQSLLTTLINALDALAAFFSSPVGIEFMKSLVEIINILTYVFVGLVIAIGSLISMFDAVKIAIFAIGGWIKDFFVGLGDWFAGLGKNVSDWFHSIAAKATGFPQMIIDAIGNLGNTLYHAGASLIQGFINGVLSMGPAAVNAAKGILGDIRNFFPFSPAKKGPFSGKGHTLYSGQALMNDFAKGMEMAAGNVSNTAQTVMSNIVFGPGSVSVSFEGSEAPTPEEARVTGSAVGAGISQQLANRDAALAVRTL